MGVAAAASLCSILTIYLAGSQIVYTPQPRGTCANCCPIREIKDVKFLLYTKANPEKAQRLYVQDEDRLTRSNFNRSHPTIFYLHGFSEKAPGGKGSSSQEIRDALIETGDYNVILVDWSPLTAAPWYANAVLSGPRVGRYVARFIRFLLQNNVDLDSMHVIGFSLGAELAGFIGKTLKEWGYLLPRITGLDPAMPLYTFHSKDQRLSPSDAAFVDIIHTDGGVLGLPFPMGHADFFPNGGVGLQPGCVEQNLQKQQWFGLFFGCSHERAWNYFVESIRRPRAFQVERCEQRTKVSARHGRSDTEGALEYPNCDKNVPSYMGFQADRRMRGNFHLETNDRPNYGRNAD